MPDILKPILVSRGILNDKELTFSLDDLPSPAELQDINKGTKLLADAIVNQTKIVIVGDYDVDGATSVVLAKKFFQACGLHSVEFIVPNRQYDDYGLNPKMLPKIMQHEPGLVLTVDNGIKSNDAVDLLKKANIITVICDHHLATDNLPAADAVINPNRNDCPFIGKNLAGVGVCFYLMCAVRKELAQRKYFLYNSSPPPNMAQYLDLVAIGTIADMVEMDWINRILVERGLRRIRAGKTMLGIRALLGSPDLRNIGSENIAFGIAPLMNSAGRLDDMSISINCLLSETLDEAKQQASKLHSMNRSRKKLLSQMKEDTNEIMKTGQTKTQKSISLYDEQWHVGLTGLLAGYLKDTYNSPAAVFAKQSEEKTGEEDSNNASKAEQNNKVGMLKASIRSIAGVSIHDLLQELNEEEPDLIERFGGHYSAAGITIKEDNLTRFSACFEDKVGKMSNGTQEDSSIATDGELPSSLMNSKTAIMLQTFAPWGKGFPTPLFDGTFRIINQKLNDKSHLHLILKQKDDDKPLNAACFNYGMRPYPLETKYLRIAYRLMLPQYRGRDESAMLAIEHIEEL